MVHPIPDGVRRFVLTSIPTVPHLETLLLLWREPGSGWTAEDIARRLYVPVGAAQALADDLCQADLLACDGEPPVNNVMLVLDKIDLVGPDLSGERQWTALVSLALLVYGLVYEDE